MPVLPSFRMGFLTKGPAGVLDHATSEIASGSNLGFNAAKELPGEGFKRPLAPAHEDGYDGAGEAGNTFQPVAADVRRLKLEGMTQTQVIAAWAEPEKCERRLKSRRSARTMDGSNNGFTAMSLFASRTANALMVRNPILAEDSAALSGLGNLVDG